MMQYFTFRAMNTEVILAAEGSAADLAVPFAQAEAQMREYERRFTRFSPDSELSALNASSGSWFQASEDLFEVVCLALEYTRLTGGLFNPGVLADLERAGYDRSFEQITHAAEVRAWQAVQSAAFPVVSVAPNFSKTELDAAHRLIRLSAPVRVDLGGIAKGWIAEQVARSLSRFTSACAVNAGGDQFSVGVPQRESGWRVALEDPFDPERDLAVLNLPAGAVCTSSTVRRSWWQAEKRQNHLINPFSGQSAASEWVSVTAIASQAAQAEVLAKSLLIGGGRMADGLLAQFPEAEVICVDQNGLLAADPHGALRFA